MGQFHEYGRPSERRVAPALQLFMLSSEPRDVLRRITRLTYVLAGGMRLVSVLAGWGACLATEMALSRSRLWILPRGGGTFR